MLASPGVPEVTVGRVGAGEGLASLSGIGDAGDAALLVS